MIPLIMWVGGFKNSQICAYVIKVWPLKMVANIFTILSGKIACANVLSDLYAMGVTECDNMLMLLAVSTKMTEKERDVVVPLMMRGFKDCALEANSTVTGGQTVMNPWCTIGGVATTVCQPNEFIM